MRFLLDNPKDYIQATLCSGQWYELDELKLMHQYCKPGAAILDIGANVGSHAVYFSKFFDAKVIYVIEPVMSTCKILLANLCLNYCHNVNVDYIGVGFGHDNLIGYSHVGGVDQSGMNTLTPEDNGSDPIRIVKGDDIFKDIPIDFIKMDVENMEIVALEGLQQTISKYRPNMFLELSNVNSGDFDEWIKSNNYKIVYRKPCAPSHDNVLVIPEEK